MRCVLGTSLTCTTPPPPESRHLRDRAPRGSRGRDRLKYLERVAGPGGTYFPPLSVVPPDPTRAHSPLRAPLSHAFVPACPCRPSASLAACPCPSSLPVPCPLYRCHLLAGPTWAYQRPGLVPGPSRPLGPEGHIGRFTSSPVGTWTLPSALPPPPQCHDTCQPPLKSDSTRRPTKQTVGLPGGTGREPEARAPRVSSSP